MSFDCSRCLAKCKADCCRGPIPMPVAILERFTPVRKIISARPFGPGVVIVLGLDESRSAVNPKIHHDGGPGAQVVFGCCPYLGHDDACTIYEHRPEVCRKFGDESDAFMTCSYQAADGRVRARPERRLIERVVFEKRDAALKRMGASDEVRAAMKGRLGVGKP